MNREQYLLTKLAEEAVEVAQMALKTQQFGMLEVYKTEDNRTRLHAELNDLFAIIEMLNKECDFKFVMDQSQINTKITKVDHYYEYSKSLGKVL